MIRTFGSHVPKIHKTAFVHESAEVIGKVKLGEKASVYPGCVLRGDMTYIEVGARTNIQDLTVIHTREGNPTVLGKEVTVGHRVILHGAKIGDRTLVGMGAVVMEADIGKDCFIAAGALVLAGFKAPAGSLIMGSPAKIVRKVKPAEKKHVMDGLREYLKMTEVHRAKSWPVPR